jgi:hypothetical protein
LAQFFGARLRALSARYCCNAIKNKSLEDKGFDYFCTQNRQNPANNCCNAAIVVAYKMR